MSLYFSVLYITVVEIYITEAVLSSIQRLEKQINSVTAKKYIMFSLVSWNSIWKTRQWLNVMPFNDTEKV